MRAVASHSSLKVVKVESKSSSSFLKKGKKKNEIQSQWNRVDCVGGSTVHWTRCSLWESKQLVCECVATAIDLPSRLGFLFSITKFGAERKKKTRLWRRNDEGQLCNQSNQHVRSISSIHIDPRQGPSFYRKTKGSIQLQLDTQLSISAFGFSHLICPRS